MKVLSDALRSRVFVRDLHAFIKTYGMGERVPRQHVLVFDEAQRAWDRGFMAHKRGVDLSEPDLLLRVGNELPQWSVLVGLVGDGQEIYSGEEGGMTQWAVALAELPDPEDWTVHCSPRLAPCFTGHEVSTRPELDLTVSLRSHKAERLHEWVERLLEGDLATAQTLGDQARRAGFAIYVTSDLGSAERFLAERYEGEPNRRYGLVASSHAKILPRYGVDNSWVTTSRMKIERWFNAPPHDPESCCALGQPVTEFGCQGLELDTAVVCWGEDFVWDDGWQLKPIRRRYPQDDPEQILRNVYRVLLTRGRDSVVAFIPQDPKLASTREALLHAGAETLD